MVEPDSNIDFSFVDSSFNIPLYVSGLSRNILFSVMASSILPTTAHSLVFGVSSITIPISFGGDIPSGISLPIPIFLSTLPRPHGLFLDCNTGRKYDSATPNSSTVPV